jgi:nitrate/TMAO reductase-like tetraheme cytochrome c subunit
MTKRDEVRDQVSSGYRGLSTLFRARPLRLAIQFGILVVILASVGAVGFVEYSAQPGFCNNCHNMVPYYESWATSSHNFVPCISCHYAPGIKAEAMGKLQAANQVVKYVTGTYGLKPWAEIEDAACLRSGCHVTRQLEGEVSFAGVRFDHTAHLGELRRGKQLRCTSCHSQIVQGQHLTVTASTCYLCHFKGRAEDDPVGGCISCHPTPPRVESPAGFAVDHSDYVRDLVSCVSCHDNVTDGSGAAEKSRCFICHNEPERLEQFDNTTVVHRIHIAEHNVECAQCHLPIEHRVTSHSETFDLDCRSCHQQTHDQQRKLYAGIGGHGTDAMPSSMYLANVSCKGCHELTAEVAGHEKVSLAREASCLSCHGTRYANILPAWQQEINRKVSRVAGAVRNARATRSSAPVRTRATVDSLLRLAQDNVGLVEDGKGAHNIAFADELLRQALGFTRQAVAVGPLPYRVPQVDLGPSVTANVCLQCHLGTERKTVDFNGTAFEHEKHVLRGGLSCTTCHTPIEDHGKTRLATAADCQSCHHRSTQPIDCARCHQGGGGAPEGVIATATGDFPHQPHLDADFTCATCHKAPNMKATGLDCDTCHESHHQPDVTCVNCHRPEDQVQAKHTRAIAHTVACTQCHGSKVENLTSWSRQICTTCHVDRAEHNAPLPCDGCHRMAPLGAPATDTTRAIRQ